MHLLCIADDSPAGRHVANIATYDRSAAVDVELHTLSEVRHG